VPYKRIAEISCVHYFLSAVDKLVASAKICMESSPGLELKSAVWTWTWKFKVWTLITEDLDLNAKDLVLVCMAVIFFQERDTTYMAENNRLPD